jgi:hypothetical protein
MTGTSSEISLRRSDRRDDFKVLRKALLLPFENF